MDQLHIQVTLDRELVALINRADTDPQWATLLRLEGLHKDQLNVTAKFDDVLRNGSENSVDPNANSSISKYKFQIKEVREALSPYQKLLNVSQFFTHLKAMYGSQDAIHLFESWIRGDLYIHDSCDLLVPYCYSMSVAPIIANGIQYNRQLVSDPPRRARSFIGQVTETVISMSQELAGAVAIADIFPYYTYFMKLDGVTRIDGDARVIKEIENDFQSLVHILNASHRFSGQSAFTNVSIFDRPSLEFLFGELYLPDGSRVDLDLVMQVQRVFCDWFARGQRSDTLLPYPFPVVTLNIKVGGDKQVLDTESFEYFCSTNRDGLFNFFVSGSNKLASCCRVINNLDIHMSIFGDGGVNIGSLRVVTTNLARIGFLAADAAEGGDGHGEGGDGDGEGGDGDVVGRFIALLRVQLDKSYRLLCAHRQFIERQIQRGACPFFCEDLGYMFLERFFLTFGINGLSEGLTEMGMDITHPDGLEAGRRILSFISDYAIAKCDIGKKLLFNVEQVPGESLAYKHATKDRIVYGMSYQMYANQFVPLWQDVDVEERLRIDGYMTKYMSGGCITHINLTDRVQSDDQMKRILRCAIDADCEHIALNYSFNECVNKHITISGKAMACPTCGGDIRERYTRIVGYFTPVSAWSPQRRDEFFLRKFE
jgi:ribonucleoside-triphosphate reductase